MPTDNWSFCCDEKCATFTNGHGERGILILVDEPIEQFSDYIVSNGITILWLVSAYNHPVNNLPDCIVKLKISSMIKSSIKFNAENELIYNKISNMPFYREIDGFNQPVDNLPLGLKCLFISSDAFKQSLDNLPFGLKSFYVTCSKGFANFDNLPKGLKNLSFSFCDFYLELRNLPKGLLRLYIDNWVCTSWKCDLKYLPESIRYLDLGTKFNDSLEYLPRKLKGLSLYTLGFDAEKYLEPFDIPQSLRIFNCYYESNICYTIKERSNARVFFVDQGTFW
jgi:hypothetical protein